MCCLVNHFMYNSHEKDAGRPNYGLMSYIFVSQTLCNKQCKQCVGSSVKFRARLSNHKSHIKQKKRMCCLVNHFIDNSHEKDAARPNCGLMSYISV